MQTKPLMKYRRKNRQRNKTNNHEQIILKNEEGVYVKTQESTKQKLMLFKMYPFIIV